MNKTLLQLFTLFICLLSINNIQAKTNCTGVDLTFTNITITGLQKGTATEILYDFTIKNNGTDPVQLKSVVIQNYVSQTSTPDQPAGGAILTTDASLYLGPGETYSNTFSAVTSKPLSTYPNLIAVLSSNPSDCDASNNTMIVCLKTDAIISAMNFSNVSNTSIDFDYDVKNIGVDTLYLNNATINFYGSMDNTLDGTDQFIGNVSNSANTYVLMNAIDVDSYTATRSNTYFYTYIIANISYSGSECQTSNNTAAFAVPAVNAVLNQTNLMPSVIINRESNSFSIKEWNQSSDVNNLKFSIFNCNGTSILSGKTSINESNSIQGLSKGIYILEISNNENVTYQRFVY